MVIREVHAIEELQACEAVQRSVWGIEDLEVLPASHLSAAIHAGGLVAGALVDETLIGFVYGFPSRQTFAGLEPYGLHSHMLAVLPAYRRAGVGKQLKWFQRNWALANGFPWVTWTFDPLQAKNARLNLEALGAVAVGYRIDAYGRMGGALNAELPTDRLLALWTLADARVAGLASGGRGEPVAIDTAPLVVSVTAEQLPSEPDLTSDAPRIRVAIPEDIGLLMTREPAKALRWRLALRELFTHYFSRGYRAVRFLEGCYLLARFESPSE